MADKGWEQYVQPTSEWLDRFKQQRLDDMLIDIWLLGDKDFVRQIDTQRGELKKYEEEDE